MSDHYWLTEAQLARIQPYFPQPHGRIRVNDRRVISRAAHTRELNMPCCNPRCRRTISTRAAFRR